jgi:hypothetical protein
VAAHGAQQAAMPVIGVIYSGSAAASPHWATAFRNGLNETGYTEGRNVAIEHASTEQYAE